MCCTKDQSNWWNNCRRGRPLKVVQCCPESPMLGDKHKKKSHLSSALYMTMTSHPMQLHYYHQSTITLANKQERLNYQKVMTIVYSWGGKKTSNVNRSYNRTAGIMTLVRPCGILVDFCEMFTCESTKQAYVFIFTTFAVHQ